LLSSGFRPVTTNTTQTPRPKPVVENIDNFQSTKLMIRLKSLANARAIEARRKVAGTPEFTPAGIFTRPSRIEQTELQPGTVYEFQFRAHGGSTGASDWSDPVAHMAT
jgi:hypothetical protein